MPVSAGEMISPHLDHEAGSTFPVLPLLLVASLLVIVILSVSLYHYKCRLRRTQEYLVRYISDNLELKKMVRTSDHPYHFNPPEITAEEFTKIIDNMLRRMMLLPLLMLFVLPLGAQEKTDSVYEFRFVAGNDMFFVPYGDNRAELERLSALVRQYHEAITTGRMPVYVDGYCNSQPDKAKNLATARLRSNRVKSELILHGNLNENCFVTRNHPEKGDWVTVRLRIAALTKAQPEAAVTERNIPEKKNRQNAAESEATAAGEAIKDKPAEVNNDVSRAASSDLQSDVPDYQGFKSSSFSLRANLLRWATLTPDLGVEWRMNRHIGILLNGSWASWSWSNKDRKYALWKLSPEVRYYIGKEKRGFLGAMYHIGEFNYKLGDTGKQGDYQGGGVTGGYTLELNPSFSLDFHAGVGYTRADYDMYQVTDGVRMRCGSETKDYWGLNQVGVTLVWKFVK